MKKIVLFLISFQFGLTLLYSQNLVKEWEGPSGFLSELDDDYFITTDHFDMNGDGKPEMVVSAFNNGSTIIMVYDAQDQYNMIFSYSINGDASFWGFVINDLYSSLSTTIKTPY